jgi:two-component system phosphate regulon response regulator PhoB
MTKPRVLIISEEFHLNDGLVEPLRATGCQVVTARTGAEALGLARSFLPEFILLDCPLPDTDPIALGWAIRNQVQQDTVPLFLISEDRNGSSSGGSLRGLIDRFVSFLIRRETAESESDTINTQGLLIDRRRHRAAIDRRQLDLTPTEFRLLWTLASKPGFVMARGQLTDSCAGTNGIVQERTVDAHVKSIRRKLGERAELVETVRGVGYRFREA